MKKIFKITSIFLLLFILEISDSIGQVSGNLIENGNFETNTSTSPTCTVYDSPTPNPSSTLWQAFFNGCYSSTGWYSSVGTADIAYENSCFPRTDNSDCYNHYASIGANNQYNQREGIFYDKNLTLSPDYVYTISFAVRANYPCTDATIKLANNLVNYSEPWNLQIVPSQTIYANDILNNLSPTDKWKYVTFDFVPNDIYHQLYIYLGNGGWWGIDNIDLRIKGPYTGPSVNTGSCCQSPISYVNLVLPANTVNRESITTGNNVTASNSLATVLSAGYQISFTPGTTLTAASNNSIKATIVNCKTKPILPDPSYGAGADLTSTRCYDVYEIMGGSKLQKGVDYSWSASPASAINYITNKSSLGTTIAAYMPNNTSVVYTLTASNNCGSVSDNMTFYYNQVCPESNPNARETRFLEYNDASIQDVSSSTFTCYPNPLSGSFTLQIPNELVGSQYSITDINGKSITQKIISKIETMIDLSNQPSGVYFITLYSNGKIMREKLILL